MEEIDIIELLQRVKEGKAPQKIQICNNIFYLNMGEHNGEISSLYYDVNNNYEEIKDESMIEWTSIESIKMDTKIKILDKPIIEEIGEGEYEIDCSNPVKLARGLENIQDKINEIIKVINNKEE